MPTDPTEGTKMVQLYSDAGVTWWIEFINQWIGLLDEVMKQIRIGPSKE
jgi:hypothetical protein